MAAKLWYDERRGHLVELHNLQAETCPACGCCVWHCECATGYRPYIEHTTAFPSDRSLPRGGDDERAFVFALGFDLMNRMARVVFADWLDEHGRAGEALILRDHAASPVVTPFRVLPYWRDAPFFADLRRRVPIDLDGAILAKRLKVHDQSHGENFRAKPRPGGTRALILDDYEAVLAGIDRWPLLPEEPKPILRVRRRW
jgi:uncharacterized protein (TIGR02996 family)